MSDVGLKHARQGKKSILRAIRSILQPKTVSARWDSLCIIRTPFGLPPPISLRASPSLPPSDGRTRIGHPHSPFSLPMVPNPAARGERGPGEGKEAGCPRFAFLAKVTDGLGGRGRGRGRRQEQRLPSSLRFALKTVVLYVKLLCNLFQKLIFSPKRQRPKLIRRILIRSRHCEHKGC